MHRIHRSPIAAITSVPMSALMLATLVAILANPAHAQKTSARRLRHDAARSDSGSVMANATTRADAIETATREYRESGVARSVEIGNTVAFPYGHSDPVLTCTVLRVCVVELEDGEQIVNESIAGDQARWIIEPAQVGPGGRNTLVVVKPKACDITTNLVIPTDRRIYDLTLDSPPCNNHSTNPQRSYVRDIRFYYPDEGAVQGREAGNAIGRVGGPPYGSLRTTSSAMSGEERFNSASTNKLTSASMGVPTALSFFDRADLNHDYHVKRERRGPFGLFGQKPLDFPWKPAAIVDDGAHIYIKLPLEAQSHAAPVLYAVEDDGSRTMVNYAVREADGAPAYVTDRIFRRGLFVVMSGAKEQHLEFENRAWGKPHVTASVQNAVANGAGNRQAPNGGAR